MKKGEHDDIEARSESDAKGIQGSGQKGRKAGKGG